jgi:hypothetical protein
MTGKSNAESIFRGSELSLVDGVGKCEGSPRPYRRTGMKRFILLAVAATAVVFSSREASAQNVWDPDYVLHGGRWVPETNPMWRAGFGRPDDTQTHGFMEYQRRLDGIVGRYRQGNRGRQPVQRPVHRQQPVRQFYWNGYQWVFSR